MILHRKTVSEISRQAAGLKIVAACGCFDVFHIGHLEYLQGAKSLGDLLIVGVNSDHSVWKNKKKHPYFTCVQRMQILDALDCVDYIFTFDERSFSRSLAIIRPAVFVRGADMREKGFPERAIVEKYRIEVKKVGLEKRASSSQLRALLP